MSTEPPGVSNSMISAAAPCASASSITRLTSDTSTGVTGPSNLASLTTPVDCDKGLSGCEENDKRQEDHEDEREQGFLIAS